MTKPYRGHDLTSRLPLPLSGAMAYRVTTVRCCVFSSKALVLLVLSSSFAGPVYRDCASSLVLSREIPLKYSSNLSDSTSFDYSENFHFYLSGLTLYHRSPAFFVSVKIITPYIVLNFAGRSLEFDYHFAPRSN